MSGARFARSGRSRFFVCLGILVLTFGMVGIFHSSQQKLDESREQQLRCEQQQEALNEQLQSILEQKFNLGKNCEQERSEQLESRQKLEQKLKDQTEAHSKVQMDTRLRYEKLQQAHKLLQSEHNELKSECANSKKKHLEDTNALEKKLQLARSELQQEKTLQVSETTLWKEKYNAVVREKEALVNVADSQTRILDLERVVRDYQNNCDYKPADVQQLQINKPLNPPDTTRNANAQQQQQRSIDKPRNEKSFDAQELVSPGFYHIAIVPKPIKKIAEETQLKQQPKDDETAPAAAPVLAAPGDAVSPLSAPRKQLSSTKATKSQQQEQLVLEANAHLKKMLNATSRATSSSTSSPANARKLPANVAPIPANFEDLLNDEAAQQQQNLHANDDTKAMNADAADIDAAVEDLAKNDNDNEHGNNNRYANVVNDMSHKAQQAAAAANEGDSGAHEIKDHDHDFMNDQNFNLPADGDDNNNNFFDAAGGGGKNDAGAGSDNEKHKADDNDDDDDMLGGNAAGVAAGAGDIAVKSHNQLLDADNLNNEVAGDQGKEFPDGLRLEDGNIEEDEDEDDYSNPGARQQGEEAIRN